MMGLTALGFTLSGCATIVQGTNQSIAITTSPTSGAQCTLVSSEGTYYVTTPGNVSVHKTKNDLQATCKKNGFEDAKVVIPAKFQYVTAGNILAGGLVGIAVDAASGANYEYPQSFDIPMMPLVVPAAAFMGPGT
jgi:hypothetical protein